MDQDLPAATLQQQPQLKPVKEQCLNTNEKWINLLASDRLVRKFHKEDISYMNNYPVQYEYKIYYLQ